MTEWVVHALLTADKVIEERNGKKELTEQEQLELLHTFITYQQQGPGAFTPHEEFMKELFDD